jgi:hypothetical protein
MVEKPFKALETPRSAIALALVAIVLGVGSTMMPPSSWPYLLALFYLLAGITAWLCRAEISAVYKRLKRSEISQIPGDFWFVMACVLIEIAVPTFILVSKPSEEDLRVSFFIEGGPPALSVRAEFSNVGKYGAIVTNLSLFEIVALHPKSDPQQNADLCNDVSPTILPIVQMAPQIMGRGAQVGGDTRKSSLYAPESLTIDGRTLDPGSPIPIESGKIQIVSAKFALIPDHWKDFDTLVVCPMVSTRNMQGINGVAICKGASFSYKYTAGDKFSTQQFSSNNWEQHKLLPHVDRAPTCPTP